MIYPLQVRWDTFDAIQIICAKNLTDERSFDITNMGKQARNIKIQTNVLTRKCQVMLYTTRKNSNHIMITITKVIPTIATVKTMSHGKEYTKKCLVYRMYYVPSNKARAEKECLDI